MTTTIMSRGNSPTASYIDQINQDNQRHFAQTAAFSTQPAIDELANAWEECSTSNWDGYDAFPIKEETLNYAYAFIQALPLGFPLPSVSAEPDGHLALDWFRDPHWTISVSMSPEGILYYAALLGNSDPRGTEPFLGEVPERLLNLIKEVALAKN
ncbi:hypothetical protein [Vacuolonema iberomarrocanum]|uniref:hypothetical protein n=1 Tax=Vacuolonema iberomarrocanum TaxID=3454632 RepID=UPI0019F2D3D9|nr:hypothetical protein [filamentous cyanobacterium LEGE 07170]